MASLTSGGFKLRHLIWPMVLASVAIGLYAFAFQLRLAGAGEFHTRFDEMPVFTGMHVIGGGVVLLVGGLQFVQNIRQNYPSLHRWRAGSPFWLWFASGALA